MKKPQVAAAVFLILMLMPFSGALAQTTNPKWNIQTVNTSIKDSMGRGFRGSTSLAIDSQNNPHISYCETPYQRYTSLMYVVLDEAKWKTQEAVGTISYGSSCDLALDSKGNPHIIYQEAPANFLNYASWNSSRWDIQRTPLSLYPNSYFSLALDSNNNPHVSFELDNNLMYARSISANWRTQIVDQESGRNSLVLDANGNPHISYFHRNALTYTALKYASWTGTTWITRNVDLGTFASEPSLALDSLGSPHMSYFADSGLKYASLNGTNWRTQTIEPINLDLDSSIEAGNQAWSNSLVLDANDNPHISYFEYGHLKYAVWTGSGWNIETVDPNGGFDCSLALDSSGNPCISYIDFQSAVKYASLNSSQTSTIEYLYAAIIGVAIVVVVLAVLLLQRKRWVKKSGIS
jgi:hypothetical protein